MSSARILLRYQGWRESSRNWLSRDFAKSDLSNPKTDRPSLGSAQRGWQASGDPDGGLIKVEVLISSLCEITRKCLVLHIL